MKTQSLSLVSLLTCVLLAAPVVADNVIAVGTTAAQPGAVAILDITIENDVPIVAFSSGFIHDPAVLQPVTMQYAGPVAADFVGIVLTVDGLAIGVLIDYELEQVIPTGGPRLVALAIYDVDPAAVGPAGSVTPGSIGNPPIDPEFTDPLGGRITPDLVAGAVFVLGPIPSGVPTNRIRSASDGVFRAHSPSGVLEETGVLPPGAPTDLFVATNGASWVLVASAQRVVHVGRTGTVINEIPTGEFPTAIAPIGNYGVFVAHQDGTLQVIYADGTILLGGDGAGDSGEDGALGAAVQVGVVTDFAPENPSSWIWASGQERLIRLNPQGNVIVDVSMGPGNAIADISGSSIPDGSVYVLLPDRIEKRVADGSLDHVQQLPPSTVPTRIAVTAAPDIDGVSHDRVAVLNPSSNQVFIYDWSRNNDVIALSTVTTGDGENSISWDGLRQLWIAGQDPATGDASLTSYDSAGAVVTDLSFPGETILLTSEGGAIPAALSDEGDRDYDADEYTNINELKSGSNLFDATNDPSDAVPFYVLPLESLTAEISEPIPCPWIELVWTWSSPTNTAPDFYEITPYIDGVAGDALLVDGLVSGWIDQDVIPGTHRYEVAVLIGPGRSDVLEVVVVVGAGESTEVPIDVGFDFTEIFDITVNPDNPNGTPRYYCTDSANGQIYGLDEDFLPLAVIASPFEDGIPCTGIAFVGTGDADNGSLIVGNGQSGVQMHLMEITLAGEFIRDLFVFIPTPALPTAKAFPGPVEGRAGGMAFGSESGTVYITGPDTCDIYGMSHEGNGETDPDSSFEHPNEGSQQKGCTTKQCAQSNGFIGCTETLYLTSQTDDGTLEIIEVSVEAGEATQIGEGISLAGIEDPGGIVFEGDTFIVTGNSDGSVYQVQSTGNFVRGDANGDSLVDIGDPITILGVLFNSDPASECLAQLDSNDDNQIDIGDAIYVLNFLFQDTAQPPAPFPDPGPDPTPSAVTPCP